MIISASRRTDIPCYYSMWFFNRIKEGYVDVRNPMNIHQVSRISLSPDVVDCIVFWTKNPKPMLSKISELQDYNFYFQFTLNSYDRDVETNLPDKKEVLIPVFRELSGKIGADRVIWRYDPILVNEKYTVDYHINAFEQMAEGLNGYTEKVTISFVDLYTKTQRNTADLHIKDISDSDMLYIAERIANIAGRYGMTVESCAEKIDLSSVGVEHGHCIDKAMIEKITGGRLKAAKDKNQRPECGCVESIDIGNYDTCCNGCKYCYANVNEARTRDNVKKCNPGSSMLCSEIMPEDKVTERKMYSILDRQIRLDIS